MIQLGSCKLDTRLSKKQFDHLCDLVYSLSGIHLHSGKESLVVARVGKRLRNLNINSFEEYLDYLNRDQSSEEIVQLLDVITTNVTSFFREPSPLETMRKEMVNWHKEGVKRFRIWSAACSTGEEPYSIAITLEETEGVRMLDWKILATDISTKALNTAIRGQYSVERMSNVPKHFKVKYFDEIYERGEKRYQVKALLRNRVVFRRLNLAAPPFPMNGPFHAVFCRNVMIYFDDMVRRKLIEEIWNMLVPGGLLCVGASESLSAMFIQQRCYEPSVYRKSK